MYFQPETHLQLHTFLESKKPSIIFVLVDENTRELCLPHFLQNLGTETQIEIIEIEAGEENKTLETCTGVWNALTELGADRKSLLINLGGGVVSDLGGFVAANFKRGIGFIHVPTTLLAMVDAAIGGKTGVNLDGLKNQIGSFADPELLLIDSHYLKTLPQRQLKSGLAEMLKHGLANRRSYWEKMKDLSKLSSADLDLLIRESVEIKAEVVRKDPKEKNLRKILNFGHTLGHAIETYFLSHPEKPDLLHGEAIAAGMILESFISSERADFSKESLEEVTNVILHSFKKIDIQQDDFEPIMDLLVHDKKNSHGSIQFVLLEKIGKSRIDQQVETELILRSFGYYLIIPQ